MICPFRSDKDKLAACVGSCALLIDKKCAFYVIADNALFEKIEREHHLKQSEKPVANQKP